MALGPLHSRLHSPADHGIQRRRNGEVDAAKAKTVSEWEKQLNEQLQGSLTYQVVKHVLLNESLSITQQELSVAESGNDTEAAPTPYSLEIELRIELELNIEFKIALAQTQTAPQKSDPLVLDFNSDGIQLDAGNRVAFDINADGKADQISQLKADNYFLALDKNGNQHIDSGVELFGDQLGSQNGFNALALYDDNHDQLIDASDRIFSALRLLQVNGNGVQTQLTLTEMGVKALDLRYQQTRQLLGSGDEIAQQGSFYRTDNSRGQMVDMLFQY